PRLATSAMPPRPAPMIVTVVAFAGWFMRGSLQSRLADWSGRLRVGNSLLLAPSSRAELVTRVQLTRFREGPTVPPRRYIACSSAPAPPTLGWETVHGETPRSGEHLTGRSCFLIPETRRRADRWLGGHAERRTS